MTCPLFGWLFAHEPERIQSDYKLVGAEKVQPASVHYLACKVTLEFLKICSQQLNIRNFTLKTLTALEKSDNTRHVFH